MDKQIEQKVIQALDNNYHFLLEQGEKVQKSNFNQYGEVKLWYSTTFNNDYFTWMYKGIDVSYTNGKILSVEMDFKGGAVYPIDLLKWTQDLEIELTERINQDKEIKALDILEADITGN